MSAEPEPGGGRRILVLFAHPAAHRSRVNAALLRRVRDLPDVVVRDLYELYPDFHIDAAAEQALLRETDLLVLLHPIHWYGAPAILKEWLDEVLTRGFAYGRGGTALHGKDMLCAVSTGGRPQAYTSEGYHGYPLEVFLRPFEQTARFCGMRFREPLALQGTGRLDGAAIEAHAQVFRDLLLDYQHAAEQD